MRPLRQPDTGDRAVRLAMIAVAGGVAIALALRWKSTPRPAAIAQAGTTQSPQIVTEPPLVNEPPKPSAIAAPPSDESAAPVERKRLVPRAAKRTLTAPAVVEGSPPQPLEPFVPLPLARAALDAVGADDDAEAVWLAAINDPAMSARDRSDLIEDLNENGFADPDDVQPEELPLVLARIDLIERVGPDAMDEANAAAFAEAYKDLVTIARRLMQ